MTWAGQPKAEDWKFRWSHKRYNDHLSAERYLTGLSLDLSIMCTGLLYGEGEGPLYPLFKAAWSSNQTVGLKKHPNVIPTLHIRDMAKGSVALLKNKPSVPVIVAHDGSQTTRKSLLVAISKAFSLKHPQIISDDEAAHLYGHELTDWLSLDLEVDPEEYSNLDFERTSAEGPVENIETLVDEFVKKRLLSPLRIAAINIPPELIQEVVSYYGLEHASYERIKEIFDADKSDEAQEIRDAFQTNEEEEIVEDYNAITKHVLATNPAFRYHGYIIEKFPTAEEGLEEFFLEDEEPVPYYPRYVITTNEFGFLERWFIQKGSHAKKISTFQDVKKFLGLPRNNTRQERLLEARRRKEQIESENADQERKAEKKRRREEEAKRQALIKRDETLYEEVVAEIESKKEIESMDARTFLMKVIVPLFKKPLAQIAEARLDDPLRFLASHFEKEANK